MSQNTITPGVNLTDWQFEEGGEPHTYHITAIDEDGNRGVIATVVGEKEIELFGAVPDMIEALNYVVNGIEWECSQDRVTREEMAEKCKSALRKAGQLE